METWKKILRKVLFPGTAAVLISVLLGTGLLLYTFLAAGEDSPIAYVSYIVSAYGLVVACLWLVPMVRRGKEWGQNNSYISRLIRDEALRIKIALYCCLAVNLLYAGVNAFSGIYYHSVWFGSLAAYYICLAVMRFSLVRYVHSHSFGEDRANEWRLFRLCGLVLTVLNAALAGMVILVVQEDQGFEYAGSLIYVMALYAFYSVISAANNLVHYKKYSGSPAMSAARAVSLAAALVSMLSLETAMLNQFGGEADAPCFRQIMTGATGGVVCAVVIVMGIYMTAHGMKKLKHME